jgi:hypothetical protein
MSTETFLLAFRRFVARRSVPEIMMSDNASTFLAAAEEVNSLSLLMETKHALTSIGTRWKFIPNRTPWFGGWWERMVGITKTCLKKCLGKSRCNFEVLRTLLVEIEHMVNHRPLTYVNSDAGPETLTPAHLLYGRRLNILPQQTPVDLDDPEWEFGREHVMNKTKQLTHLFDRFRERWRNEYLTSLREIYYTTGNNKQSIQVGDVVQIHDEGPRVNWRLAVVVSLLKGNDGLIRSAVIKTSTGVTNRPISKLYPLEIHAATTEAEMDPALSETVQRTTDSQTKTTEIQQDRPKRTAATAGRQRVRNWTRQLIENL